MCVCVCVQALNDSLVDEMVGKESWRWKKGDFL